MSGFGNISQVELCKSKMSPARNFTQFCLIIGLSVALDVGDK